MPLLNRVICAVCILTITIVPIAVHLAYVLVSPCTDAIYECQVSEPGITYNEQVTYTKADNITMQGGRDAFDARLSALLTNCTLVTSWDRASYPGDPIKVSWINMYDDDYAYGHYITTRSGLDAAHKIWPIGSRVRAYVMRAWQSKAPLLPRARAVLQTGRIMNWERYTSSVVFLAIGTVVFCGVMSLAPLTMRGINMIDSFCKRMNICC